MKKTAYQVVQESREELVKKIISNMEKGYIFSEEKWDRGALVPQNPSSQVKYKGVNKLRLSFQAIEQGYKDPRWLTFNQAKENNYKIKKGERGTLCEKWIWEKTVTQKNEKGEEEQVEVPLKKPIVSYFLVFNAEQFENFPIYEKSEENTPIEKMTNTFIESSECKIKEVGQDSAFYSPLSDEIVIPPRNYFKDSEAFLSVLLHEMSHSTGHKSRFNRPILNLFGTPEYAKEELRAELSAVFMESELGINHEIRQDHTNYFLSWIQVLKDNPAELFSACNDSSKIADKLIKNYEDILQRDKVQESVICDSAKLLLKENNISDEVTDRYKKLFSNVSENDFKYNKAEYESILKNIDKIDSVNSKVKVFIFWSEDEHFNNNEVMSFSKANEKIKIAEEILNRNKQKEFNGYNKTKLMILFFDDKGKLVEHIADRYDIGDGYRKDLKEIVSLGYYSSSEKEWFSKQVAESNLYENTYKLKKELISEKDIENPSSDNYENNKRLCDKAKNQCKDVGISDKRISEVENIACKDLKFELEKEIESPVFEVTKVTIAEM